MSTECYTPAQVRPESVPESLKNRRVWFPYKRIPKDSGGFKKVPYAITGEVWDGKDTSKAVDFDTAYQTAQSGKYAGIGIIEHDGVKFLDADKCIEDGAPSQAAQEILDKFCDTYAELSPSNTGFTVICTGKFDASAQVSSIDGHDLRFTKFRTITGNIISGAHTEVSDCTEALSWLADKYFTRKAPIADKLTDEKIIELASKHDDFFARYHFGEDKHGKKKPSDARYLSTLGFFTFSENGQGDEQYRRIIASSKRDIPESMIKKYAGMVTETYRPEQEQQTKPENQTSDYSSPVTVTPEKIIEKAFSAKNGDKIQDRFAGNFSSSGNDKSDSARDKSLLYFFAPYCQSPAQLEEIARQSKCARDKWDEKRKHTTWIGLECENAINKRTWVYDWNKPAKQTDINPDWQNLAKSRYRMDSTGLYHIGFDKKGNEIETWLCDCFEMTAQTRDENSESWGILITFRDPANHQHKYVLSRAMCAGGGEAYREDLQARGLSISADGFARKILTDYLQTESKKIDRQIKSVSNTGWHGDVYVLPDEILGNTDSEVILQAGTAAREDFRKSGDIEQWQKNVSRFCANNSRLTLAVSTAFASILLEYSGDESGGYQFTGGSSIGKTTVLFVAGSVFGGREFIKQWRATSNGLESIAANRNDSLLCLDELAQVESREAGDTAYMLANGTGKSRANKQGEYRQIKSWRLLFLSTGEIGLVDHMKASGKRTQAGQETRLVDIPADTGKHGIFEDLHEFNLFGNGAELSKVLKTNCRKYHGTASREFINKLLDTYARDELENLIDDLRQQFVNEIVPQCADGQVYRVAARFALAAIGGEMATRLGVTGWNEGEAVKAAQTCFNAWLRSRGTLGSLEKIKALEQVRYFFAQYSQSRFIDIATLGTEYEQKVQKLAGFRESVTGDTGDNNQIFYVFPEVFTGEIAEGLNIKNAVQACIEAGYLTVTQESDGQRTAILKRFGDIRKRVYQFSSLVLE